MRAVHLLWIALALGGAACGQRAADPAEAIPSQASAVDTVDVVEYAAVGLVTNIMANKKYVIIQHEEIPGYMDAMSMPFAVEDPALLDGIAPRDSVRFRFAAAPGRVVILEIEGL